MSPLGWLVAGACLPGRTVLPAPARAPRPRKEGGVFGPNRVSCTSGSRPQYFPSFLSPTILGAMTDSSRGYQQFLAELKRRRVFRVMAMYGVVAFIVGLTTLLTC